MRLPWEQPASGRGARRAAPVAGGSRPPLTTPECWFGRRAAGSLITREDTGGYSTGFLLAGGGEAVCAACNRWGKARRHTSFSSSVVV